MGKKSTPLPQYFYHSTSHVLVPNLDSSDRDLRPIRIPGGGTFPDLSPGSRYFSLRPSVRVGEKDCRSRRLPHERRYSTGVTPLPRHPRIKSVVGPSSQCLCLVLTSSQTLLFYDISWCRRLLFPSGTI